MLVTYNRKHGTPLTPEQIAELEALKDYPIVFDEDCPEMTEEQLKQFKRVKPRPAVLEKRLRYFAEKANRKELSPRTVDEIDSSIREQRDNDRI